tara:strand:+ start:17575 stop:18324 length:750 start_codon:yes stop_codon:yes gene_type:complete
MIKDNTQHHNFKIDHCDPTRYKWLENLSTPAPNLSTTQRQTLVKWALGQLGMSITPYKLRLLKKAHMAYSIFPLAMVTLGNEITKDNLEVQRKQSGGTRCPCCSQYVKEYKRKLSKNMAKFLQSLVFQSELAKGKSTSGSGWVHFKKCEYGSHDYPYVSDFGLAERHPDKQGYYRPTQLGILFAFGKADIPKHIYTYNGKVTGEENARIKIEDIKFERFDLDSMLQGEIPLADTQPIAPTKEQVRSLFD